MASGITVKISNSVDCWLARGGTQSSERVDMSADISDEDVVYIVCSRTNMRI